MHRRFIYRQITSSLKQTFVFVACVALSLVTLVSLGGFGESVNNALLRDARKLLGADILVESGFPFAESLETEIARLESEGGIQVVRSYQFITIARSGSSESTLLSEVKAIDAGYPLYGEVALLSGQPFGQALNRGEVLVGQSLLERMQLQIGDSLKIGQAELEIADVVLSESDQPVDFFNLGPRIFLAADDLKVTGLVKLGSRVNYRILIRVAEEAQVDDLANRLAAASDPQQVRVDTYRTNQSAVQRFFENLLTFLSLIGIFTLLLAGIGIQSSLGAFIREREETIAILRTFGATGRFIMAQFFAVAAVLGLVGTFIGLGLGIGLQSLFPYIFGPFLPPQVEFILSPRSMLEGILLGFFVVAIFTFLPIYQLQAFKPRFIFRKETSPAYPGKIYFLAQGLILLFLSAMTFRYLQDPLRTVYFALGISGLVLIIAGLTRGILSLLRRQKIARLDARQALRGLFRPRNATSGIIITLAASLSVLFTIYLIERNLNASFIQAYPEDAPNVVLLDIQPDQRAGIQSMLGGEAEFIPLVQARIKQINGVGVERDDEASLEPNRGPDPNRPPRLGENLMVTYRDRLEENEELVEGRMMFTTDASGLAQVSIGERFLEAYSFSPGDIIQFEIQGVPLDARVSSIRRIQEGEGGFDPGFNFVFREQDLVNAPQTIVTTTNLPPAKIPEFQNKLVEAYPNVTVINVSAAIEVISEIVGDITVTIRFFMLFSIFAGILIIISSILATRFARIQESVYFKVLGAKSRFVLRVFALENVFIGFVSAFLALFLSQLTGWILITQVFELSYTSYWGSSILLMLFTIVLVTSVGLLASISILKKKPISFLREQTVE